MGLPKVGNLNITIFSILLLLKKNSASFAMAPRKGEFPSFLPCKIMSARYRPASKEVVRIVFTLRNSDKWSLSRIGARYGKSKQWDAKICDLVENVVLPYGGL